MIKNSIIYRRIWYIKRRNSKKLYIYFRLLSIVIILALLWFYAENYSMPCIMSNMEQELRSIVRTESINVISGIMADEAGILNSSSRKKYEEKRFSDIESSFFLDSAALKVSEQLEERLGILNEKGIRVPFGALFGNTWLAGSGPAISLKSRLCDRVESKLKSEKISLDGSNTKYGLYMDVHVKASISMLLKEHELDVKVRLPIVEEVKQNTDN